MTVVHAFDADGTPSRGAQTALDNATEGLASETYVDGAVDGLASEAYVNGAVDGLATEQYADSAQQAAISHARVPAMFTYGTTGGIRYAHFRTFAGRPTPGLITKRFATTDDQNTGTGLVPTRETLASFTRRTGAPVAFNASGWKVSGNIGEMRGAQILNGQVFHDFEDFNTSPAGVDAMGVRADGTIRMYSKRWGDTAASMVGDGVLHSFSYGPVLILDGSIQELTDARWAYFIAAVTARQIIGVNALGELMVTTTEGKSEVSGLTAPEAATLAASLGYHHAILMDGGGSAQAQAGNIQAMPSADAAGARPVPDALCAVVSLIDCNVDTGWVDCALGPGFSASSGGVPQVRREGNRVFMRRGVSTEGMAANGGPEGVVVVPPAFLPDGWKYGTATGSTSSNGALAILRDGGKIQIRTGPTLPPYYAFDNFWWPLG